MSDTLYVPAAGCPVSGTTRLTTDPLAAGIREAEATSAAARG